jgi:2'-5' RNA ligase
METIRTFVAIDVYAQDRLLSKWKELKNLLRNDSVKWVEEESLHLTLFFLGETSVSIAKDISHKLVTVLQSVKPFDITLQGVGTFGKIDAPKVIWIGIAKSDELHQLKEIVSNAISSFGFQEQQGIFSPHFTLGRMKHLLGTVDLSNFINLNKATEIQKSKVDKVIFYQSILTPKGPIYKPLKIIKLPSL